MDEYSWAGAVGRIRVLEKRFLSRAELSSLAAGGSLESTLGALRDTIYGLHIAEMQGAQSYTEALQDCLVAEYGMIAGMAPEPMVIAAYRGRHDFHNLKVIAKNRRLGMAVQEEAFSRIGNIDPDTLIKELGKTPLPADERRPRKDDGMTALRQTYEATAQYGSDADSGHSEALDALLMDASIDRAYYAWFGAVMKRYGYDSLVSYAEHEVDLINLRMFLRGKKQGLDADIMAYVFLPGGTISESDLNGAYAQSDETLAGVFGGTPFEGLAVRGMKLVAEKASLTDWEKTCDDAIMSFVKRARYSPLGPEPAYGYVFGRETETRNLRVILSGKQSQVSPKEISERLREPYG